MIEVTHEVLSSGIGIVEITAEVTRLGTDDYVVIWSDLAAVQRLGLSGVDLLSLTQRSVAECRWLEWEREACGITGLIDGTEPMLSAARDNRIAEPKEHCAPRFEATPRRSLPVSPRP